MIMQGVLSLVGMPAAHQSGIVLQAHARCKYCAHHAGEVRLARQVRPTCGTWCRLANFSSHELKLALALALARQQGCLGQWHMVCTCGLRHGQLPSPLPGSYQALLEHFSMWLNGSWHTFEQEHRAALGECSNNA
ncbi:hypothetical protein CFOL_v3_19164 [Cephalotus follicularis]|uniref:Uncharacterized protein n=1 Tax=Cephalotus follicularis TaxID=3775 RepID=A0A1Q3C5Y1_CEPFO|nr:hypothetical protein CFOL_v3_19164 [Cephalotus follicularis]